MEAAASDYVKLNEILAEKAAAQEEIDELYAQWEAAAEAMGENE